MSDALKTYPAPSPIPSLSITPEITRSAWANLLVCAIALPIAVFWVILRVVARFRQGAGFYFNDYAIFFALFWGCALAVNSIISGFFGGTGHHMVTILTLAPERLTPMLRTVLIGQFAWGLANTGVKVSMLDLYLKLFGASRKLRIAAYGLLVCTVCYCGMVIMVGFLACTPFEYNWNPSIGGSCAPQKSLFLASSIINLSLDVGILLLPLPQLLALGLPLAEKLGIISMFTFGTFVIGVSIWRTLILYHLDILDLFYPMGWLSVSSNLEPLLGISITCVPITRTTLLSFRNHVRRMSTNLVEMSTGPRNVVCSAAQNISRIAESSLERRNFERLYNHLYPLSGVDGHTQVDPESQRASKVESTKDDTDLTLSRCETCIIDISERRRVNNDNEKAR